MNKRHFIRHPMCFPLTYKVIKKSIFKGEESENTATINVSRGGLLFSAKRPAEISAAIIIKIPFQDKIFKIKAKVVYCNEKSETKLYDIGVCFMRVNEAFKVKLIEQMYLISEYRDLRSMQLGKEMTLQDASQEWIERYSKRFQKLYW